MSAASRPFCARIDILTGELIDGTGGAWHLADMSTMFRDAPDARTAATNPCIYTTSMHVGAPEAGDLTFGLTRISAGKVGDEYFMTRGHVHDQPASETYTFLAGSGGVLCRRDMVVVWTAASAGSVVYIPADWAHRTINTGLADLVFLSAVASNAGHDYALVEAEGMGARVIEVAGKPTVTAERAFVLRPPGLAPT